MGDTVGGELWLYTVIFLVYAWAWVPLRYAVGHLVATVVRLRRLRGISPRRREQIMIDAVVRATIVLCGSWLLAAVVFGNPFEPYRGVAHFIYEGFSLMYDIPLYAPLRPVVVVTLLLALDRPLRRRLGRARPLDTTTAVGVQQDPSP